MPSGVVVAELDKLMVAGSLYTNELIKYVIDLHPPVGLVY
jgi:hypothetical protein